MYDDTATIPFAVLLARSGEMEIDLELRLGASKATSDVIDTLVQHIPRIRALSLRLRKGFSVACSTRLAHVLANPAPRLRAFVLKDPHSLYNYQLVAKASLTLFGQHAPLLTSVKATSLSNSFLKGEAFSNVRQLVIHPERQLLDIPSIISSTPVLETLGLYCENYPTIYASSAYASGVSTTRHLHELWMRVPEPRLALPILRSVPHWNLQRTLIAIPVLEDNILVNQHTGNLLHAITKLYFGHEMVEATAALDARIKPANPIAGQSDVGQPVVLLLRRSDGASTRELAFSAVRTGSLSTVLPLVRQLVIETSFASIAEMRGALNKLGVGKSITQLQIHAKTVELASSVLEIVSDGAGSRFPNLKQLVFQLVGCRLPEAVLILDSSGLPEGQGFGDTYQLLPPSLLQSVWALTSGRPLERLAFSGWSISESDLASLVDGRDLAMRIEASDAHSVETPEMWKRMNELSDFLKLRL